MSLESKKILGIPITLSLEKNILEEVKKYLKNGQWATCLAGRQVDNAQIKPHPFIIFTPNPEIIEFSQKDPELKRILNSSDINLPDGIGVTWAVGRQYGTKINRISGIDMMEKLVGIAADKSVRIGLLGGKKGVALSAAKCLLKKHPGVQIEVFEAGKLESRIKNKELRSEKGNIELNSYFIILNSEGKRIDEEKYFDSLLKWIEQKQISILFVALGFPKQEYFIQMLNAQCLMNKMEKPLVLMAVGGSFDYIAGEVKRAPLWVRERGLEWLYRLMKEPSRIMRQIRGGRFFLRILGL